MGLLSGLLAAYIYGSLALWSKVFEDITKPSVNFLRSIPVIVLLPLFLLLFGATNFNVIFISGFAIFSKLVVFVADGLKSSTLQLHEIAKLQKLTLRQRLFLMDVPASVGVVATGLQLSASRAYSTVVLCGLVIGGPGLGQGLRSARDNGNYDQLFAYGVLLAAIGVAVYILLLKFENGVLKSRGLVA